MIQFFEVSLALIVIIVALFFPIIPDFIRGFKNWCREVIAAIKS